MKLSTFAKMSAGILAFALAFQAQAKPSSDDFNSLIEENNATQKELTTKLAKQLKTEKLDQHQKPNFNKVGEEVLGRGTSENVVVAGDSQGATSHRKLAKKDSALEKKNFKRLSEELKDVKE